MRVLIVGGGAREHALAWKIQQSPLLTELIAAPGNPGIAAFAKCHPVKANDLDGQVELAVNERIDLVVVGPEDPLAGGLVDRLGEAGILAFGPNAAAARLEASKAFSKPFMRRHGIPTGDYEVHHTLESALDALKRWPLPLVVKADGLAVGKGVTIAHSREEAEKAVRRCMVERIFGAQGATVVFEEFLDGEEVSLIGLSDGKKVIALAPAEDHKAVFDGDMGPNTGGMGCFSPVPALSATLAREVAVTVLQRAVDAMAAEGSPFRGALFAGLILTAEGPKVLEFNARFGDPETEVILPRMKSDLLPVLRACAEGCLTDEKLEWSDDAAVCVMLASGGYPGSYRTGLPIHGLAESGPTSGDGSMVIFHAGTAVVDGQVVTAGGRVLAVTATGKTVEDAIRSAYESADRISFEGLHRRSDIGRRKGSGVRGLA